MKNVDISVYCEILSIHTSCFTIKDVKQAYRQCVLKYHPDTNPDNDLLNKKFAQIVKAYNYLKKYCQNNSNGRIDNFSRASQTERTYTSTPKEKRRYINSYYISNDKKIKTKQRITINDLNFRTNNILNKTTNEPVKEETIKKKKISLEDINYSKYVYKNKLLDYRRKLLNNLKTNLETKKIKCKVLIHSEEFKLKLPDIIFRLNYSTNDNVKLYCIRELEKSNTKLAMWSLIKALNTDTVSFYLKKEIAKAIKSKSNKFIKKILFDCRTRINNFFRYPKLVSFKDFENDYAL